MSTPFEKQSRPLKNLSPAQFDRFMRKSATLNLRLTPADKEDMERTAKGCGLTLTEYITRLHQIAVEKLMDR